MFEYQQLNETELNTYNKILEKVQTVSCSSDRKYVLESLNQYVQILNQRQFTTTGETK